MALVVPQPELPKTGASVPALASRIRGRDGPRTGMRRGPSARLTPQTLLMAFRRLEIPLPKKHEVKLTTPTTTTELAHNNHWPGFFDPFLQFL